MSNTSHAIHAYKTASRFRSQRDQEADVFLRTAFVLKGAKGASQIQQIRALADNRRLWMTVNDLLRDPANALPEPLRVGILSVGMTVQKEMDQDNPDFEFLISINEHFAAGLSSRPDG